MSELAGGKKQPATSGNFKLNQSERAKKRACYSVKMPNLTAEINI